ncbi:MAG: hypothetical protein N3F09_09005 [Bacteroidia bacterium]|nr:hypothetical protein [Bacteroidia bacterium]
MKPYLSEKWIEIGNLSGGADIRGYLQIKESTQVKWKKGMFVMIEKDGLPVPFEVKDYYFKHDIPYLNLYLFPTDKVSGWKNSKVSVEKKFIHKKDDINFPIGYEIVNARDNKSIGTVRELHDFSSNVVISVISHDNSEILIPFSEDLIIRKEKNVIYLNIPDGLV